MQNYSFTLAHSNTCLRDYFGGDHGPCVSICINSPMTLEDIKKDLHSEISSGSIAGGYDYTGEEKTSDNFYKALHLAIDNLKNNDDLKPDHLHFTHIEFSENEEYAGDMVQAYFVFLKN